MSAPTVVFDLDGTLVDTAPDLVATLNVVLAGAGFPPVAFAAARNMVGGGARALIERGAAAAGGALEAPQLDRLFDEYIAHYSAHIADRSRPFPGVETALAELERAGCRLAVCTNKLEGLSKRLLDALGLAGRFAAICGADTFAVAKPDPAILHATVARAGGELARTVMVGDSATDIRLARAAGIAVIAVDFGYSETPVAELHPDRVAGSFAGVPEAVFALLAAKKGELAQKVNR